jgi:O-antigen/teichoic acid export membrane protein
MVPEISRLTGETADPIRKKIITINRRAFSVIFLGGLPAYLLIFAFATPLLKIWLGHTFLETIPVAFRIMLVATFVSLLGVPAYYTFMGQGNFKFCVFSHMIQSIMNVFVVAIIIYFWVDALVPGIYVAVLTGFCGSSIYLMWKLWNEFCRPVPINRESERRESMLTPKKIA